MCCIQVFSISKDALCTLCLLYIIIHMASKSVILSLLGESMVLCVSGVRLALFEHFKKTIDKF